MKKSEPRKPSEKKQSPHCLPDIPLPTPPPMANIMVTSRFDLPTRGGCGYRRILSSRSSDFRSPMFNRHTFDYRSPLLPTWNPGSLIDGLGLSPMMRHKTYERQEDRSRSSMDLSRDHRGNRSEDVRSKYLSKDSLLLEELEEVKKLSEELESKCNTTSNISELSPEYQNIFYNDHYISDIDENEEIKEFVSGYVCPERRYSDHSDKMSCHSRVYSSCSTLPSTAQLKERQKNDRMRSYGSSSSMKSSDYYSICTPLFRSGGDLREDVGNCVMKNPQKPLVKLAKIR
ncbi:unnamed protein product [Acanthoscelides obtectus]|uniref:Uncharacterized protein n=1 Tax=Acanthoscelides obtectus TaxID=200917 RepID=A0A9P0LX56_ACAOB|nr:unnamed protein product [Acanthoscelides obtectus]CAK1656893.1 hypothetical protein AOBTE_LOCUS20001 [Acanthoscelides obtectus]